MLALLLNPKNLLIALLSVALAGTWLAYDVKKHAAMKCEVSLVLAEKDIAGFKAEVSSLNAIIEALKANLAAIKKQAQEWQRMATEANDLRRRIIELQNTPRECEVLQNEYSKVAGDITDYFNSARVRGKIKHPDAPGDRGPAEVLPGPGTPGPSEPVNDAPTPR